MYGWRRHGWRGEICLEGLHHAAEGPAGAIPGNQNTPVALAIKEEVTEEPHRGLDEVKTLINIMHIVPLCRRSPSVQL